MGFLDRLNQTANDLDQPESLQSLPTTEPGILAQDERPYVVRRVEVMMNHFIGDVDNGTKKGRRTAFLMKKLIAEAAEEASDVPPEMMEFYFKRAAAMMYWAATGMRIENIPLPPSFKPDSELETHDAPTMTPAEIGAWAAVETTAEEMALGREREMLALEASVSDE